MGRIGDDDIQRVRDATDLVAVVADTVVLQRKGRLYWGRCPFHDEKTPSLKIDPSTQLWHCFGCGLGGDVFGFAMRTENIEFPDAVRMLAERAHVEIVEVGVSAGGGGRRERLYAACAEAAAFYHQTLLTGTDAGASQAREYLKGRGFGTSVAKSFELGYAPGRSTVSRALREKGFTAEELVEANLALKPDGRSSAGGLRDRFYERVMFPIRDVQGRCVGFGGRVLGTGEPKYLNTQETPVFHKSRNLYGIDRARNAIVGAKAAIVVEGYTDVIALHEAGLTNAVATLGTALTSDHMKLLGRFTQRIVYLFDGDEAGLRAADRASEYIGFDITPEAGRERVDLEVAMIPGGMDPADLVQAQGADSVRTLVDEAVPLLRYALDRKLGAYDLSLPENRARALADAATILASVKTSLLVHDYTNYVADRLLVDFSTVQAAVASAQAAPRRADTADDSRPASGEPPWTTSAPTPQSRAELELLGVLGSSPSLRAGAQFLLLPDDLLTVPSHRRALGLMRENPAETIGVLVLRAQQSDAEVAALLSGLAPDAATAPDEIAQQLIVKLKEFRADRLILLKKSELKSLDPVSDQERYDELFREISVLQKDRSVLRMGEREESRGH